MQRSGAAECHKSKLARIIALLHRNQSERTDHIFIDDIVNPLGGALDGKPERLSYAPNCRFRLVVIDFHVAAESRRRGQITKHHVGVGDGWLVAALGVGGRARVGAGAFRADAERLGEFGHVRNRTASSADRAHVEG